MFHLNGFCASRCSESCKEQVQGRFSLSVATCKMLKEKGRCLTQISSSVGYAVVDAERSGSHGQ